jgi:protein phosphatase
MEEDTLVTTILDAVYTANANIVEAAAHDPALKGMGTTVTLALVRGADVMIADVGDSRAYFIDGAERRITQVTTDHTVADVLVAAGCITRAQAETHPMKKVLYRVLGQAENLEIDIHCDQLRAGDGLVLCSDGLTRHVKAEEIMKIVLGQRDPEASCQRLVDLANQRGGEDNVSVVVMTALRAVE